MAFLNDITLGQYYAADSFLHRLDPRTKLIAVGILMILLLATAKVEMLIVIMAIVLSATIMAKLPLGLVARNLKPFFWLFALTAIIQLIYTKGTVVATVPVLNLDLSREGIYLAFLFSLRLALLIIIAAILTLSTSPIELMDAMEHLLNPLKRFRVPVHDLVMVMSLALRFIPTLTEEAERIRKAQISRGASFEGTLLRRLRSIIPLILPLFISAFRRADDLAMAMDSRCYHGGEGRTSFNRLAFDRRDYLVFGFLAVFSALAFFIIK